MRSKILSSLIIIFSLVAIPVVWYNFSNKDSPVEVQAVEEGPTGPERRITPEEVVFCAQEVPIGEAIEEAMDFAYKLSKALSNIQWAINEYINTVQTITELAGTCNAKWCSPSCTLVCAEYDDEGNCIKESCIVNPCLGDPCPARALIEEKFNYLANLSRTIEKERSTIDYLLNIKRPEIQEKLDKSRWLFEKNAPTVELYELLRGPTPCQIAINNFWVELEDVQEGKVCKSLLNYLICR